MKRAFFNYWQMLMFIKIALLYGSDDEKNNLTDKSRLEMVGKSLLIINDLVGLGSKGEKYEDDTNVLEALIRNGSFFAREQAGNLLPRYYDLFSIIPKEPDLCESPNYTDIDAVFRGRFGFELDLFLALGFGIYSHYGAVKDFHPDKYVINASTFFNKTIVPDEIAQKTINLTSISREQFRKEYIEKYGSSGLGNYFDFTLLRKRPLVKIEEDVYVPVDIRFLVERISTVVYWDICDSLDGEDRRRFMRFFGEILQKYLEQLFRRIYPESTKTTNRAFYDVRYNGDRASDIMVFYDNKAVFIEVVVGRLRMKETTITGDYEDFRRDISIKIVEKSKQIDRVIKDFRSGRLILPGWSASKIKRYYPLVVTVSPLPLFLKTYDEVRNMIDSAGHLISSHIADLEIASVGEMEAIEPLLEGGHTLAGILEAKTQDKYYKRIPLYYYLYDMSNGEVSKPSNKYLIKRKEDMFRHTSQLLFDMDSSRETAA